MTPLFIIDIYDKNGKKIYVPKRASLFGYKTIPTMTSSQGDFGAAEFDTYEDAVAFLKEEAASLEPRRHVNRINPKLD